MAVGAHAAAQLCVGSMDQHETGALNAMREIGMMKVNTLNELRVMAARKQPCSRGLAKSNNPDLVWRSG
jgi:hypothetical protein